MRYDFFITTRAILYILLTSTKPLSAGEVSKYIPLTRQTTQRALDHLHVRGYVDFEESVWRVRQGIKVRRYFASSTIDHDATLARAIDAIVSCDLKKWQAFSTLVKRVHHRTNDIPF